MSKSKTTKLLPLTIEHDPTTEAALQYCVRAATGHIVCYAGDRTTTETIVRAVNAHDDLVAAMAKAKLATDGQNANAMQPRKLLSECAFQDAMRDNLSPQAVAWVLSAIQMRRAPRHAQVSREMQWLAAELREMVGDEQPLLLDEADMPED